MESKTPIYYAVLCLFVASILFVPVAVTQPKGYPGEIVLTDGTVIDVPLDAHPYERSYFVNEYSDIILFETNVHYWPVWNMPRLGGSNTSTTSLAMVRMLIQWGLLLGALLWVHHGVSRGSRSRSST